VVCVPELERAASAKCFIISQTFLIQSKSVISGKPGDSLQLASSCEADQKRLQGAQSLRNNQNTVQNVRMSLFFDVFRIKHQGERNAVAQ
jgi:hypothetical protein